MDKTVILIIIAVVLVGGFFWVLQSGIFSGPIKPTPLPAGIVLFYGQGCPHCKDVEDFISQNKIDEKVKITRLEVWYNRNNQATLAEVVQKCGISASSVGVPFLYAPSTISGQAGKCYIGEVDVPNFLKTQAGIK